MNTIYDNGDKLLGQVKRIKEYNDRLFRNNEIDEETWVELAKELVFYDDTDIVSIDFGNGMGLIIEKWDIKDILEDR